MPTPFGGDGIVLPPNPFTGAPTTGTWEAGTIVVDATGTPYICQTGGAPGTWQPIGLGTIPAPSLVSQYPEFIDTFVNGVNNVDWIVTILGGGNDPSIAPPAGKGGRNGVVGVVGVTAGATTTGRIGATLGTSLLYFAGGHTYDVWMRLCVVDQSALGASYVFRIGFIDSGVTSPSVDGAYFEYDTRSSPNWRCVTASNSTTTTVTTGTVVDNANWHDLHISVDGSAQIAKFYVDDVLVATINTKIPNSPGRETSLGFFMGNTAGTILKTVALDRIYFKLDAP